MEMEKILCIECGEYHDESNIAFIESVDGYVCQSCLNEHYTQCDDCCEYVRKDCMYYIDGTGEYVCESCLYDNYERCADCGKWHRNEDMQYISCRDKSVCESCLEYRYARCDDCGEYVPDAYSYVTANDYTICDDCYSNSYFTCEDCGNIYHWDDVHSIDDCYYCPDCAENHDDGIGEYHSVTNWIPRYVNNENESLLKGFELEVEKGDYESHTETVESLKSIFGDLVVYERDGSLNYGFECITHPMTTDYFVKNENVFKEGLKTLIRNGYTSHNNDTCGLHVHVNREQLTLDTTLSEDEVINNIVLIMETFKEELTDFSRRTPSKMKQWAKFLTDFDGAELTYDCLKNEKSKHGRYVALNLTNRDTIEFRIFKGTLKFETIKATLQLVDIICNIAKSTINGLTWDDIVSLGGEELRAYNKKRGIVSEKTLELYGF